MLPLLLPLILPFNTNAIVVKKSSCKTAVDCSYSGECIHGVCKCNVQWSGPNCTTLNLMPSLSINAAGMRRNTLVILALLGGGGDLGCKTTTMEYGFC